MSRFADRKDPLGAQPGAGSHLEVKRSRFSLGLGRIVRDRAGLVCALLAATGCAPHYYLRTTVWEPAAGAVLVNDNVTIRNVADGWELRPGQMLATEAGPRFAYYRPAANEHQAFLYHYDDGTASLGCGGELLTAYSQDRFSMGPRNQVIVDREVSGTVESYHGVIMFIPIAGSADEIAKRRWQISIPDRYFASARGGGISVVYGTYDAPSWFSRELCYGKKDAQPLSWVLWLSDFPLLEEY